MHDERSISKFCVEKTDADHTFVLTVRQECDLVGGPGVPATRNTVVTSYHFQQPAVRSFQHFSVLRRLVLGSVDMSRAMESVVYLVIGLSFTGALNSDRTNCNLPEHPRNGYYKLELCDNPGSDLCKIVPGSPAEFGTVIAFACHKGYQLQGLEVNYCRDGVWNPRAPTCEPVLEAATLPGGCKLPETPSHGSYAVRGCRDQHTSPACTASPASLVKSGTVLDYNCEAGYYIQGDNFMECVNGKWVPDVPTCSAVCGKRTSKGESLIANGGDTKVFDFPWNVAIYPSSSSKPQLRCGGTLISPRMIVTAAHCVSEERRIAIGLPPTKFAVVAGKYYSDWNATEAPEKQIRQVSNIYIPETYRGQDGRYASNIAVLVLNEDFKLTWAVQPICVDWDNSKERVQLRDGNIGSIVGWGIMEDGEPSTVLKTANISYVDLQTCWTASTQWYRHYFASDSFCAGYTNGTAPCWWTTGGGLAFEYDGGDRSTKQWYLRGVLSTGGIAESGACVEHKYTLFTKVSQHIDWIKTHYNGNL